MTRLAPFAIHRATSIDEATALIEEHGDDAALYAGGTELLLLMKLGLRRVRASRRREADRGARVDRA